MLVNNKTFELFGYLSALSDGPSFVVPLFSSRSSNMFFVQEIGIDGCVHNFRETAPKNILRVESSDQHLSIGDEALWGFCPTNHEPIISNRRSLQAFLRPRLDSIGPPFIKLQAAQFCEDVGEIIEAWKTSFKYLADRSPKSADAWRDFVIIPTQMRLALENAILNFGLDASTSNLSQVAHVDIDQGDLRFHLSRSLYEALSSNPRAASSVKQQAAPVIDAFKLKINRIDFLPTDYAAELPAINPVVDASDIAVAAFGDMAISLISHAIPRFQRFQETNLSIYRGRSHLSTQTLLLQHEELSGNNDWGKRSADLTLNPETRIVLVIFQLTNSHPDLIRKAIDFANYSRDEHLTFVAIIPHLLQEFDEKGELAESIIPSLNKSFDSIWVLNDRSPHTRQTLPIGPARSIQAATSHFYYILNLANNKGDRIYLTSSKNSPSPRVNVVGSAVGDRAASKLAEHALSRLAHYIFDFEQVSAVKLMSDTNGSGIESIIRDFFSRRTSYPNVEISSSSRGDGGPNRVLVALDNVLIKIGGRNEFEKYSIECLEQSGWAIRNLELGGRFYISSQKLDKVPASFAYINTNRQSAALKKITRWHIEEKDGILITNAIISRRMFALHVLSGTVPIHYSRIDSIAQIYRNRYKYAFTYLTRSQQKSNLAVILAGIDWLNINHGTGLEKPSKLKDLIDIGVSVRFDPNCIRISLPKKFFHPRSDENLSSSIYAIILFKENGWHFERLNIK